MNKQNRNRLIDTENKLTSGHPSGTSGWFSEIGEGDPEVQISSYKINKSQGCNVQHWEYSQ